MKNEQEMLNEINQRATRLESRLVQLGNYVGANLRTSVYESARHMGIA